jgi:predicted MFS family arabinose efflux permease
MSFTLALMLGPFLNTSIGVDGIFWLTAVLAVAGIAMLYLAVPDPEHLYHHRDVETVPDQLKHILLDTQLARLDLGIMLQHGVMMAMFTALPFVLRDYLGLASSEHGWFYLPILALSVFGMVPLIILAEKKRKMKQVFIGCIALMAVSELMLGTAHESKMAVGLGLLLFFVAFNALEASLPSLISRMAPADGKGTAMGVYSTSQFLGAFLGGVGGGWLYGAFGVEGVFYACAATACVWIVVAMGMRVPAYLSSFMVHVELTEEREAEKLTARLLDVSGIHEAKIVIEDGVAYLKVDKSCFDQEAVAALVK